MAGSNSAFDADLFRTNIRAAMTMGLPNKPVEQATFQWRVHKTYQREDSTHRPYDWTAASVTSDARADVKIPVAVEFGRVSEATGNAVGSFENPRVTMTILDEDYELIKGASHVLLGENVYEIDFVAPPIGLFDVTVYQIFARARSES